MRCHPSVLSHHALGTVECDESYCIEGTIFGRSFVGVREFVYHESYCDESGIMTIYGFQIVCDLSSAGSLYGIWVGSTHIWVPPSLHRFLGCIKTTLYYYWIPKFQKNQYLDRYIPGSSTCSTKELSITMTKMLHAVKGGLLSYCDKVYSRGNINQKHCIGGIMVSVLASSVVDHGFEPRSNQEL